MFWGEAAQGAEQMYELILAWTEEGIVKSQKIQAQQPSKYPGTVRIGRDPSLCDIIISHPTVSGLHIEIFLNQKQQSFYLRNLRHSNPPLVDRRSIITEEVPLREGSSIYLGQIELKVVAVFGAARQVPPTIVMPHQPSEILDIDQPKEVIEIEIDENKLSWMVADIVSTDYFQQLQQLVNKTRKKQSSSIEENPEKKPIKVEKNINNVVVTETSPTLPPETDAGNIYGSMCLKCYNIAPYQRDLWCIRCGNSMETAAKVLIEPKNH